MEYGLIGEKLGHSFSAQIHNSLSSYDFVLKEIARNDLDDFFEKKDFKGITVTIPYKEKVFKYLDYVDDIAKEIGAVNTVLNKNGKLYGYNTDYFGLLELINEKMSSFRGKKVLILGSGGTSKTANAVSKKLEADKIITVSLHPTGNQVSYNDAITVHNDANVLINTTPVGMYPDTNSCPIDINSFNNLDLVVDVVYNPLRTKLSVLADELGIPTLTGLYMLVSQAFYAAQMFIDKNIENAVKRRIFNDLITNKQNIVLIGMPSCGKTTVGKILAERLGREFIDTDELIVKKTGLSIPEIFENFGEKKFRETESEVIKEISTLNGVVIATGGGAVLNLDNAHSLKNNGVLFFLNRSVDELLPTPDRPLSKNFESIVKMYHERFDVYNLVKDFAVRGSSPEAVADKIIKIFKGIDI